MSTAGKTPNRYFQVAWNHKGQPMNMALVGRDQHDAATRFRAEYPNMTEWHQTLRFLRPLPTLRL